MTEIRIPVKWKNRLMRWTRYLIIVFTMWTIWLTREYIVGVFYANTITVFQGIIMLFTIIYEEHTDSIVNALEIELNRIKNK